MESFISMLNDTLHINGQLFCFIISLFPILELRGGLIAAALCNVPMWQAIPICIIGNFLPIPFLVLFIEKILNKLKKSNFKPVVKFVDFLENKAEKKAPQIMKYKTFGLTIFIGIPLPVTGAWTGGMVAGLFNFNMKQTMIATCLGLCMSASIMTIITYGIPYLAEVLGLSFWTVAGAICGIAAVIIGTVVLIKKLTKKKKA